VNIGTEFPDLDTLAAVIARSQIVIAALAMDRRPLRDDRPLPAGFDDVDIAVLEWIAAEGRRVGSQLARF
jgi:hypothetical protein